MPPLSRRAADSLAYDEAKQRLQSGEDEAIPFAMIERRLAGESLVKIWREYRALTQAKLAEKSGVSRAMIAAIETGNKTGSVETLKAIAAALKVGLDDLV